MPPLLDANASSHEMHATENANISALLRELPFFTTGIPSVRKDPPRPIGQLVYCQASTAPGSLEVRDCRLPRQRCMTMIITLETFFKKENVNAYLKRRLTSSSSTVQPASTSSKVVSKSPVYQGTATSLRPAGPIEQEAAFFLWIVLEQAQHITHVVTIHANDIVEAIVIAPLGEMRLPWDERDTVLFKDRPRSSVNIRTDLISMERG